MAEGNYTLRMLTTADTSGLEKIDAGMKRLGMNAEQLGRVFEEMARSGMGAQNVNLGSILQSAPLLIEAWDLGTQIGTTIGDAVTRVGERGFSLDNILGKYDARFDESIQRWREGMRKFVDEMGKEPPPTLLQWLDEAGRKMDDLIDKEKHLRQLQKSRADHEREMEKQGLQREKERIKNDPTLTDAQKDRMSSNIDKRLEAIGYEGRTDSRYGKVQDAIDKERQAGSAAEKATQAVEEQRRRVEEAKQRDLQLQEEWTQGGGQGSIAEKDGKQWAAQRREGTGFDSFEAEKARLAELEKKQEKARQQRDAAQRESRQAVEVFRQETGQDAEITGRRRGNLSEDEKQRQIDRMQDQAGGPVDMPAVSQAAQEASQAMTEGSSDVATSMREISATTRQGFQTMSQANAEALRVSQQSLQMAQEALRTAQQAAQANANSKQSQRYQ